MHQSLRLSTLPVALRPLRRCFRLNSERQGERNRRWGRGEVGVRSVL